MSEKKTRSEDLIQIRDRLISQARVTSIRVKRSFLPPEESAQGALELEYDVALPEGVSLGEARLISTLSQFEVELAVLQNAHASGVVSRQFLVDQMAALKSNYSALAATHASYLRGNND